MTKITKILVLGSGGREHVFVWKLAADLTPDQLYVAPGNAGMDGLATRVSVALTDFESIADFCLENNINTIIPGSEEPLVAGIVDYFKSREELKHIFILGPSKEAAKLEGSKTYCKSFMQRHGIPTAAYRSFDSLELDNAKQFLHQLEAPYVLKADGLAAGKGVLIINDIEEAKSELDQMMIHQKFGKAGNRVVIEEFMDGIEFSVFVFTDGKNYKILPEAKDYKRIGEGDSGLNTGGMGAVSPVVFADEVLMEKVRTTIINPTMKGILSDNLDYTGFIFFGLINVKGTPKVIEYNVRMGDPETEVVFPRIETPFLKMIQSARNKELDKLELSISKKYCTTVFTVSGGYPESFEKNKKIAIGDTSSSLLFHAGTSRNEYNDLVSSGGRVIAVSSLSDSAAGALQSCYKSISNISFEKMYYRRDIGQDLLTLENK